MHHAPERLMSSCVVQGTNSGSGSTCVMGYAIAAIDTNDNGVHALRN